MSHDGNQGIDDWVKRPDPPDTVQEATFEIERDRFALMCSREIAVGECVEVVDVRDLSRLGYVQLSEEERIALCYMAFGGEHPNHSGETVRSIAAKLGYAKLAPQQEEPDGS